MVVAASDRGFWGLFKVSGTEAGTEEAGTGPGIDFVGELPLHHASAQFLCLAASSTHAVYGCGNGLLCQLAFGQEGQNETPTGEKAPAGGGRLFDLPWFKRN